MLSQQQACQEPDAAAKDVQCLAVPSPKSLRDFKNGSSYVMAEDSNKNNADNAEDLGAPFDPETV